MHSTNHAWYFKIVKIWWGEIYLQIKLRALRFQPQRNIMVELCRQHLRSVFGIHLIQHIDITLIKFFFFMSMLLNWLQSSVLWVAIKLAIKSIIYDRGCRAKHELRLCSMDIKLYLYMITSDSESLIPNKVIKFYFK